MQIGVGIEIRKGKKKRGRSNIQFVYCKSLHAENMTSLRRKCERNEDVCVLVAAEAAAGVTTTNQIESLNNSNLNLLSPILILFQDRHFAEVKALQTRLEEQHNKNKTLTQAQYIFQWIISSWLIFSFGILPLGPSLYYVSKRIG